MYFKKLEMLGFKSFCEKTTLNFEPGITAIVGPNGCGKSNIFDAVRWVLGEQSVRAMRGNRMEDVIFNGTDKQAPLGFAEVSLTFSNEAKFLPIEYDEVTITRRLFRSGESEYLINKNVVRLKDVLELFMGTGVGAESYSIIEQGKIDLVISSKPEERRVIFDEAAGITKYKSKKREALNKLEDTENNLLRINDIITEVKRQIGSIERQANKARKYKEEFDRLKGMEVQFTGYELGRLRKEKAALLDSIKELQDKEAVLAGGLADARQNFVFENERLKSLEQKINEINSNIIRLDSSVEMNNRNIEVNKERINETVLRREKIEEQKQGLLKVCQEQEARRDAFKQEMAALVDTVAVNSRALEEKKSVLEEIARIIKACQETITKTKKEILEVSSNQSKVKNELTQIFAQAQGLLARKRRLELEKLKVVSEKDQVDNNLLSIGREIESSQVKIQGLQGQKINLGLEIESLKQMSISLKDRAIKLGSEAVRLESQKEFLEDLKLQYQDMPEAINGLLFAVEPPNGTLMGILGRVKEIRPLGAEESRAAKEIFQNKNLGQIRQIICETKYIDLDPQKIVARIAEIRQQIAELKNEEIKLEKVSEEKNLAASQLDKTLHLEEMALSNKETQRDSIQDEADKLNSELELLATELSQTTGDLEELALKEETLKKTSLELEEKFKQAESTISQNENLISQKTVEREQGKVAVAQLEAELFSLKDKETTAGQTLKMLEDSLNREKENLTNLLREYEESKDKVRLWEEEIVRLESGNKEYAVTKGSLNQSLKEESSQREELARQMQGFQQKVKDLEDSIGRSRDGQHGIAMQEQEINFKEQSIRERMQQSYKINIDELAAAALSEINIEELTADINKLKEKLESYGTVNLVAIEEYEELKQRYEFLTQQQNDLLTAKESLHSTILKINRTTRQLFNETFNKVAEEFRVYFKALFGGGEAQLILIDPEDVLETGIEIIARPPGKKLQSISLLSGGEKALTAIALIFAVFKIKPSPFCVLDEIDAALDESNVGRFSYLLKDFTRSSQFIVITHNKKTIVNADVMYGITMQQTGISKIVSVKFADNSKAASEPEVAVSA